MRIEGAIPCAAKVWMSVGSMDKHPIKAEQLTPERER